MYYWAYLTDEDMEAQRSKLAYQGHWHIEVTGIRSSCWRQDANPGSVCWSVQLATKQSLSLLLLSWLALVPFQLHLEEKLGSQLVDFCGQFMNYYITL